MSDNKARPEAICQRCGNQVVSFGLVTINEDFIPGYPTSITQLVCASCAQKLEAQKVSGLFRPFCPN